MPTFSANLGFLWQDRSLVEGIHAAMNAGFAAVECHWPYDTPTHEVSEALLSADMRMMSLNTRAGDRSAGEMGFAAVPGQEKRARQDIDEAVEYAEAIDARCIHVLAGNASGDEARSSFLDNIEYACASAPDRTILIEPLNRFDAPTYFLKTIAQARQILREIGAPNLRIMFDCYHVGRTEKDVIAQFDLALTEIGHIQFASVPDRGPPDHGEVDYRAVFAHLDASGWDYPIGAEYISGSVTDMDLQWMQFGR